MQEEGFSASCTNQHSLPRAADGLPNQASLTQSKQVNSWSTQSSRRAPVPNLRCLKVESSHDTLWDQVLGAIDQKTFSKYIYL